MINRKAIKKECCNDITNRIYRTKTPTYRETICKKCGFVHSINEITIK